MALHQERRQIEEATHVQNSECGESDNDDGIPFEELGMHRLLVQEWYRAKREKANKKGGGMVAITHMAIERVMRNFRTHRCALDFDSKFVNMVVKTTKDDKFWTKKEPITWMTEGSYNETDSDDEDESMDEDNNDKGEDYFELPDYSSSGSETEDETEI